MKICISRPDSIGDVILTLPIVTYLNQIVPKAEIHFIGRSYTSPIIQLHAGIKKVLILDDLLKDGEKGLLESLKKESYTHIIHVFPHKMLAKAAKKAGIKHRIGTSHRLIHWTTCNHRINFTRKNSDLHEAQLNFHLLRPFGIKDIPDLKELSFGDDIKNMNSDNLDFESLKISSNRKKLILHPKSQGSAVEWGVENFIALAEIAEKQNYLVLFTGTENEAPFFRHLIPESDNIVDLSGKLSLEQLITLIQRAEGIVAASTGPLHIGGMMNIKAVGLFSPRRPIHPGRWQPLGEKSRALLDNPDCEKCKQGKPCNCIQNIRPETVLEVLKSIK